jgi:hypothetical protein
VLFPDHLFLLQDGVITERCYGPMGADVAYLYAH